MTQCRGTTLKGERCRREAAEGSTYCSLHEGQAERRDARAPEGTETEWDTAAILETALGVALIGAIVFFRIRR